jgi:hypothetical protein
MVLKKIIPLYAKNDTKTQSCWLLKQLVHIITTQLWSVKFLVKCKIAWSLHEFVFNDLFGTNNYWTTDAWYMKSGNELGHKDV